MMNGKPKRRRRTAAAWYFARWDAIERDAGARRLGDQIRRQQQALRAAGGDGAWRAYLRLEELVNERHAYLVDRLVRAVVRAGR